MFLMLLASDRQIGMKTVAVAVLEETSVMNVITIVNVHMIANGDVSRNALLSELLIRSESFECCGFEGAFEVILV